MYLPLDGPSVNSALSVTDTAVELKVGSNRLECRTVVTIQPLDGVIYFGFSSGVTASNGTKVFKGQYFSIEAGQSEEVWLIAESGETVDVRISERS
jgi:fibrillarin-like rRNA methylase